MNNEVGIVNDWLIGLTAAWELHRAGRAVVVLEADSRVGRHGRIHFAGEHTAVFQGYMEGAIL